MFTFEPKLFFGAAAAWGAIGFLCTLPAPETPLGARGGQWAFWLALIVLLVSLRPVHRFLAALPRPHAFLLAGFFALLLAGQLADRSKDTFPFVSWKMFSMPAPASLGPIAYYEYYGRTDAAERVPLNPERLFPSLKNYRMAVGLMTLAGGALDPARPDPEAARRLSEALRALGARHNRENPGTPVRGVEMYRCQLDPRPGPARRETYRWRVWHVEVAP